MTILTEGGIRPGRYEFVVEPTQGETPDDPAFEPISDRIATFEPELGPEPIEKAGIGDVVHDIEEGPEENAATLEYDLQRWLKDSSGNLQDFAAYGIAREAGALAASLTVVERMEVGDAAGGVTMEPESTVEYDYNGNSSATARASRVYTVLKGVDVESPTLSADIEEGTWMVETDLAAEEGRSFQIDQPNESTLLALKSTDAGDTNLTVVLENEDGTTREEKQLDGTDATTLVSTSSSFGPSDGGLDVVEVRDSTGAEVADHQGDIIVSVNTGTATSPTEGDALAVMYGRLYYESTHGDYGIPSLGTGGSRAGEIGTEFYKAANVGVERPPGNVFEAAGSVQGLELSFENEIERTTRQRSRSMRQHHGMQTPTLSVTVDGETISHRQLVNRMSGEEADCDIIFDAAGAETVTLPRSKVSASPRTREAESPNTDMEFELRAQEQAIIANESV